MEDIQELYIIRHISQKMEIYFAYNLKLSGYIWLYGSCIYSKECTEFSDNSKIVGKLPDWKSSDWGYKYVVMFSL